jgi:hypothetical protein
MTTGAPGRTSWSRASQHLGRLLRERRAHGDRRHRAHEQERRDDHRLVRRRELEHRLEHADVVAQRRVHVHVREHHRPLLDHLPAPEQDLAHPHRVGRGHLGHGDALEHLVAEHDQGHVHRQVA